MRCEYTMWVWWSAVDAKCGGTRNMKGDSRLNCGGASWRRQILEVAFFANRRCCASRPKSCSPTQMHSRDSTHGSGKAIGPRRKALSKKYIRCVPFVTFQYKSHRPSPSLQITVKVHKQMVATCRLSVRRSLAFRRLLLPPRRVNR